MLCETCLRMFSSGLLVGEHHTEFASLTKAAADGCRICTPLLKGASDNTENTKTNNTIAFTYNFDYFANDGEVVSLRLWQYSGAMRAKKYHTHFMPQHSSLLPVHEGIWDRRSTIPMAESLKAAREWMNTCLNEHEQCQKHIQPHIYPTRLLKLGNKRARLIFPHQESPSGPYAALSYCWGPNPGFIRLTGDNLEELQRGIPYSDLPLVFQEALGFIEGLGIRYLWIDALCIIQSGVGSSEDWQSECGRMQEVYSNCLVNLSLAQAPQPDKSCLGGYTFDVVLPFSVDIVFPSHGLGSGGTGPSTTYPCTALPYDYFKDGLYHQPIGRRAWVMQERLLATRVLSIGHGELFWDCQQLPHASESLPYGFALYPDRERLQLQQDLALPIQTIPQQTWNGRNLGKVWAQLLTEYTARELTYPRVDKLAALSAIATRMGSTMNDTYLAGHFWKTLPESLNWRASYHKTYRLAKSLNQMPDGKWVITPTWSWASMHGPLDMSETHEHDCLAATESSKLAPISEKEPIERVEYRILLSIRTWCRLYTWEATPVGTKNKAARLEDTGDLIDFTIDDLYTQVEDGECLLAGLSHDESSAKGLLLRAFEVDGHEWFERFGWFHATMVGGRRPMERWFTHGQQSITLC